MLIGPICSFILCHLEPFSASSRLKLWNRFQVLQTILTLSCQDFFLSSRRKKNPSL